MRIPNKQARKDGCEKNSPRRHEKEKLRGSVFKRKPIHIWGIIYSVMNQVDFCITSFSDLSAM